MPKITRIDVKPINTQASDATNQKGKCNGRKVLKTVQKSSPCIAITVLACGLLLWGRNLFSSPVIQPTHTLNVTPEPLARPSLSTPSIVHTYCPISKSAHPFDKEFDVFSRCKMDDVEAQVGPHLDEMQPDIDPQQGFYSNIPSKITPYLYTELRLSRSKDSACIIKERPWSSNVCEMTIQLFKQVIDKEMSKKQQQEAIYTKKAFSIKGMVVGVEIKNTPRMSVGINPQNQINFEKALAIVDAEFLQAPDFYEQSDEQLIEFIKKLHLTLVRDLPEGDKLKPGQFREQRTCVFHDDKAGMEYDALLHNLKRMGTSKQELKTFKKTYSKLIQFMVSDDLINFTPQEKATIDKIATINPDPKEIKKLMIDLVREWKKNQHMHPVALASWLHENIGKIHAFIDGNGRLARLLLNAVLARGGYDPVVFNDDEEYTKQILLDRKQPGSFSKYLEKNIMWNRVMSPILFE